MSHVFSLQLRDYQQQTRVEDVESFVGEDSSGSFGIMAHHARMMTSLLFGLARYRQAGSDWTYLALPGGLMYFRDNTLTLISRRIYIDQDFDRISHTLTEQLLEEEQQMASAKRSLERMEEELLRQIWLLGKEGRETGNA